MKDIKEVLELHEKWLNNEEGGVRADLKYANLTGIHHFISRNEAVKY